MTTIDDAQHVRVNKDIEIQSVDGAQTITINKDINIKSEKGNINIDAPNGEIVMNAKAIRLN